ncbi:type II secretion system protein [Candidatus Microgenomates bacterium]|nr:type II secretion system protein [Candidatus Microgenomates bacterium]
MKKTFIQNKSSVLKNKYKLGFTLIEMLVVISIIGILTTLALASFTGTQKQARDTRRKSDLKQYQTSLEEYATKSSSLYPAYPTGTSADTTLCGDMSLTNCPADPKNETPYLYRYITDGTAGNTATEYSLWTTLEGKISTYWVTCSTGKVGETATAPAGGAVCPL